MNSPLRRVGLVQGQDRRRTVFQALAAVRTDLESRLQDQILIKPNFLSSTNQLASSHVDAVRGVIDFLLTTSRPPRQITVAEGGNERYGGEAFENFAYGQLCAEYDLPIQLVDLNQEQRWVETPVLLADGSEVPVCMPRTVLDAPCTLSLAIAKTHDVCVVTLALKNMIMGTIRKQDRILMHGFRSHTERTLPAEARVLNINLIRLARHLTPTMAVIDGSQGLQGNGPGGTDAVSLGVAVASADVYAADAVMAAVMGFAPQQLGLLHYASLLGLGAAALEQIEVVGPAVASVRRPFKPHETTALQLQWQEPAAAAYLQASA